MPLVYVFTELFIIILECALSTYKKSKSAVKQEAMLSWKQPHTFHVYCIS